MGLLWAPPGQQPAKPGVFTFIPPFTPYLHKVFNSFGWEFSVISSSRGTKTREQQRQNSSISCQGLLHLVCFIFHPQGVFGAMRHGRKKG